MRKYVEYFEYEGELYRRFSDGTWEMQYGYGASSFEVLTSVEEEEKMEKLYREGVLDLVEE